MESQVNREGEGETPLDKIQEHLLIFYCSFIR